MSLLGASLVSLLLLSLALTAYAGWRGAPWLPTPPAAIDAGLAAAGVGPLDLLVDVGAGDGRVLLAAARRGARAIGYELSPFFWLLAWLRTRRVRQRVSVKFGDGFRADLSQATVLFAFLRPATMPRLAATLNRRRGTGNLRVVSYAFALPDRPAERIVRVSGNAPCYVYRLALPARAHATAAVPC